MSVLVRPIVTEKMTKQGDSLNRYGFVVSKKANKLQIKKAVEDMYSVSVDDVNTMIYGGKAKSRFTKTGVQKGKTNAYKKAVVTLVDGDKIDFYSNI
ncbi:MAG TPA: 50S ribosomal protein L23 [Bacteroidales bacterium]|nr:MAG: 50S ribosomal protein L23 [Bacteroidetes bacterium GWF2_33_38]OFY76406.1 MAG: 50S ribosomal protein L23 [Bacteroidetes bacterium RIFOXYA12_FULL_33_9]HBF88154.1 50S ribosomal protein L23 [Bacteroidales bacterium]